jgi:2-phosphoglycolate phosphatase
MPGRGGPLRLPVRAVLFDLDGTLADTATDLANALNALRVERGLPPMALAALRGYASHGARGLLGAGMGLTQDDVEYEPLREAFLAHYERGMPGQSRLFEGADSVFNELERRGLPWGIVTNKTTRFTLPLVAHLALLPRAGTVICGDTTPHAKPHPAPLLQAARELGCRPAECVYVGDAERDVTAGVAAGMKTLIANYGYFAPEDTPERWRADGSIDSLPMLLDWLPAGTRR